ncbi:MAG TPA: isochorismatase family protein [Kofleriaceae bacterium]|nr:isochorismatase family protein [Kofleriaceae bacterium]
MNAADLAIDRTRAALLVIDIQDRLAAAMDPAALGEIEKNTATLIEVARRFAIPVVVSEQYPRGLGHTRAAIAAALAAGGDVSTLEKVEFGVCEAPGFSALADDLGRDQWIVTGMETHVCVYQSVRQLAQRGAGVFVVGDAVLSRAPANRAVGLALCERAGAIVTSTETVAFDVLGRAGGPDFKAISQLIK